MKYIRGLSQSVSGVVAKLRACLEEHKARIHNRKQSEFRPFATQKKHEAACLHADTSDLHHSFDSEYRHTRFRAVHFRQCFEGSSRTTPARSSSDTQVVLHSMDENTERTVTADSSGHLHL